MTKVSAEWIASQGFQVDYAAKSRTHMSFSGSAGQIRKTFGTELHYYRIDGKKQFANHAFSQDGYFGPNFGVSSPTSVPEPDGIGASLIGLLAIVLVFRFRRGSPV